LCQKIGTNLVSIVSLHPYRTMQFHDRSLIRKLAVVLVVKVLVLTGLWWGFVREQRLPVDAQDVAAQLLGAPPSPISKSVQE